MGAPQGTGNGNAGNAMFPLQRTSQLGTAWQTTALLNLGDGVVLAGAVSPAAIYRSTDGGLSWVQVTERMGNAQGVNALASVGSNVVVAGDDRGHIWRSTNGGQTWTDVGAIGVSITALAYLGTGVVVAGSRDLTEVEALIYRSTDNGATWALAQTVLSSGGYDVGSLFLAPSSGYTLAGLTNGDIYESSDSGSTWTKLQSLGADVSKFLWVDGNSDLIVALSGSALYASTDQGSNLGPTTFDEIIGSSPKGGGGFHDLVVVDATQEGSTVLLVGGDSGQIEQLVLRPSALANAMLLNHSIIWQDANYGGVTGEAIQQLAYLGRNTLLAAFNHDPSPAAIYRSNAISW